MRSVVVRPRHPRDPYAPATRALAALLLAACGDGRPGDAGMTDAAVDQPPSDLPHAAADATAPPDGGDEWEAYVLPRLAAAHMPGMSVAVARGGQVVWQRAWGVANLDKHIPVTPQTLFTVGEISRLVTVTAVLQAIDSAGIALDDDVNAHLPFSVRTPSAPATPITWRMVLTHTASIRDRNEALAPLSVAGDTQIDLASFLPDYLTPTGAYASPMNYLGDAPGSAWLQSSVGVTLAAYLAENTSVDPFETLCQRDVFKPLGMDDATFRLAGLDDTRLATPYQWTGGRYAALAHLSTPTFPDRDLRVSAPSLARLLAMYLNGGTYGPTEVLRSATVIASRTPQRPAAQADQGLVWRSRPSQSGPAWGQTSLLPGFAGDAYYLPGAKAGDGVGIVVLTNGTWNPDAAPILEIENRLIAEAPTLR